MLIIYSYYSSTEC